MTNTLVNNTSQQATEIIPIQKEKMHSWLSKKPPYITRWIENLKFNATTGSRALIPGPNHQLKYVLIGISDQPSLWDWAQLPIGLNSGVYKLSSSLNATDTQNAATAWALSTYQFNRYQKKQITYNKYFVTRIY